MKRTLLPLLAGFFCITLNSQNIADGLRYSTDQQVGTARFTALSGAMGALGGDFSAININPAGGAVFLSSNLMLSTALFDVENKSNYFNNTEKSFSGSAALNQFGGAFVRNNSNETSTFKKFTIALNYNTTRSLDNEVYAAGTGNNSIGSFFLQQAQGIPLNLLQLQQGETISSRYANLGESQGTHAQNAFLGYHGFIFDPTDPSDPANTSYISNISNGSFNQEYINLSQGYNNKLSLNLATQITEKYYLGINLNTHTINFKQGSFLRETNNNPGSTVTEVGFENNLFVNGVGISAQVGAIAKLANNIRLGIGFDSPTWYQISEETTQYLESRRMFEGQSLYAQINPGIINVYEDYSLRTPAKITASAAYIFDLSGFISVDYSYKDYSSIKFSDIYNSHNSSFSGLNAAINNSLKGVSTFNAGAEYRINQLSLRGGFHYEESPYQNTDIVGDLIGFSVGTGYNFGFFTCDLAYSRSEQSRNQPLYAVGLTDTAKIDSIYNNFILSLGFKF